MAAKKKTKIPMKMIANELKPVIAVHLSGAILSVVADLVASGTTKKTSVHEMLVEAEARSKQSVWRQAITRATEGFS